MATWEIVEKTKGCGFRGDVYRNTCTITERMQVPGGWLVRTVLYNDQDGGHGASVSMVFLPKHHAFDWKLD